MTDREQANYEDTKFFLSSHRRDGTSRLAELGYACLKLNQSLGLCDPKYPWLINQDGAGFQYQSLTSLPLDAATKAHFALKAMTESTQNYLQYRQMRFVVDSDVERLEQTLEHINHFLRRLIKSPGRFTQHDEEQAREFMQTLNGLIVVRLDDFPIDQYALEMFRT
ncbi:hypothetical protein FB446DRAFT_774327 [Lentinula raphanica]|nr:hypothetical protein FB446DRAFT_774327 [Lentinula raphanica]